VQAAGSAPPSRRRPGEQDPAPPAPGAD
jgi:hypothetical protein